MKESKGRVFSALVNLLCSRGFPLPSPGVRHKAHLTASSTSAVVLSDDIWNINVGLAEKPIMFSRAVTPVELSCL